MATTERRRDTSTVRPARERRGLVRRRAVGLSALGAVALLAAACSSSTGTNSSAGASTSSAGPTGTGAVVQVIAVPTYGHILANSSGMPLYTLQGTCTGGCASAWPALTVPAGTMPTGGAGVTGTLGTVKAADGANQVTYNGSPLYTFTSDSSGNVTGQGVAGFSVVKVSGSTTASTTSTTTGARY